MLLLPKSIVSVQPYVPTCCKPRRMAFCLPVWAQQPTKIRRIGYLGSTSVSARTQAFRQGLQRAWIRRGKNIVIEWRRHEGKVDRLPALATELVRLKVDVIVVTGVGDLRSAKEATATIPIVMVVEVVSSPVWRKTPRG